MQVGTAARCGLSSGDEKSDQLFGLQCPAAGVTCQIEPIGFSVFGTRVKVATELVTGDVLAVEPGLVVPGLGGMRVEDLVLVGDDGVENLTAAAPDGLRP